MNIDSGAADAVAVDIGVAKYQLAQREEGKYKILDEPIQSEQYGIGFAKGNEELRDTVCTNLSKGSGKALEKLKRLFIETLIW